ncbi:hypothetical protein BJ508DRAFT_4291 [Ascobolus immersus RN42]|uniref:Uncharacterized protein n=1 Tax=Ascobolus immersus RN42 TaxID=1160509 RepID=A0A3N4IR83_ASCIM|nr:hypothetical protein BJ508DRAFT_4291 [Ascobolus immersus RN42]
MNPKRVERIRPYRTLNGCEFEADSFLSYEEPCAVCYGQLPTNQHETLRQAHPEWLEPALPVPLIHNKTYRALIHDQVRTRADASSDFDSNRIPPPHTEGSASTARSIAFSNICLAPKDTYRSEDEGTWWAKRYWSRRTGGTESAIESDMIDCVPERSFEERERRRTGWLRDMYDVDLGEAVFGASGFVGTILEMQSRGWRDEDLEFVDSGKALGFKVIS